jgi:DNA-binding LacI/PurR family transcriptional regulator
LIEDHTAHRLAGVLFATAPHELVKNASPLVTDPRLPRVMLCSSSDFNIPAVVGTGFLESALDYLRSRGRRRVASMNHEHAYPVFANMPKHLERAGFDTEPHWHQFLNHFRTESAYGCARLLFAATPRKHWPDALIVSDDNLAEAAVAGAAAAGVRKTDVEIVVETNWPLPPECELPVTHIGYDANELMAACIRVLDMQRAGETSPMMTQVCARMEM